MTWAIGTKLAIFSITCMMLFSAASPAFADSIVVHAPPADPPSDTPKDACDALDNPGQGKGKIKAKLQNECASGPPVAVDDLFEFAAGISSGNILDNDLNSVGGDNSGLTLIGTFDEIDDLHDDSSFLLSSDGSFVMFCQGGEGTLTFSYTIENLADLSDTANVTITCP